MRKEEINYFPTQNETKASTSERAILTVKLKIFRNFTHSDEYSYLQVLEDIADTHNNGSNITHDKTYMYHRTIGVTPAGVTDSNQEEVRLSSDVHTFLNVR